MLFWKSQVEFPVFEGKYPRIENLSAFWSYLLSKTPWKKAEVWCGVVFVFCVCPTSNNFVHFSLRLKRRKQRFEARSSGNVSQH